jgi:hypothetical protein
MIITVIAILMYHSWFGLITPVLAVTVFLRSIIFINEWNLISCRNCDSSVGIAIDRTAEELGFVSRQGQEIFLLSAAFRPTLGPIYIPIQLIPLATFSVLKLQGHETNTMTASSI